LTRLVSSGFSGGYAGSGTELEGSDPTVWSNSMSISSTEFKTDSGSELSNSNCCGLGLGLESELSTTWEASSFVAGAFLVEEYKEPLMADVEDELEGSEPLSNTFEGKVEVIVGE
jgi:hypothetical protein